MARWYVIDENLTSFNEKTEQGEFFKSEARALVRAKELADRSPGDEIFVCKVTHRVLCAVLPAKVSTT